MGGSKEGIRNSFFKWRVVAVWAFFSFYQSLVLYNFAVAASSNSLNSSGKMIGLWDVSTMAFTCVVVTANLRLLMACNSITRWHHISIAGSILAWFIFIFVYSGVMTSYDRQIIQEIHRNDPEVSSRTELMEIGNRLSPDEERNNAISQLPRETSKHTGFAFDSPGYESFFASEAGVFTPQKAWDVARRASMRTQLPRTPKN